MPVDPLLVDQVLRTPEGREVTASPIVRAIILADPTNASDLVSALNRPDSLEGRNARRVLCKFGPDAAVPLLAALAGEGLQARAEGLEVLWCLLVAEDPRTKREAIRQTGGQWEVLLDDQRPLPDHLPEHTERDFTGRVCDNAFIVVSELLDPDYDQSFFRALDYEGRDQEIARLKRQVVGGNLA